MVSKAKKQTTQQAAIVEVGNDMQRVPFNRLVLTDDNVRMVAPSHISELAESLFNVGQKQNLVVSPLPDNESLLAVTAGKRRFMAFQLLVESGRIPEDFAVNVKIEPFSEATTTSLTENLHREGMHPIDEYRAFAKLHDEGTTIAEIAAKMGTTELVVKQRLTLGSAHPDLLEECYAGRMNVEQLKIISQLDKDQQTALWASLPNHERNNTNNLRQIINQDKMNLSHAVMKFITVEAYQAEGGVIINDLFSTQPKDTFISDSALALQMANEKMQPIKEELENQGWGWVEYGFTQNSDYWSLRRIYTETREFTEEEKALYAQLEEERAPLIDKEEDEETGLTNEEQTRLDELTAQMEAMDEACTFWGDDIQFAGVYFYPDNSGNISYQYGLVKREDSKKLDAFLKGSNSADGSSSNSEQESAGFSQAIKDSLAAYRGLALQAELIKRPDVALVLVCHTLVMSRFNSRGWERFITCSVESITGLIKTNAPDYDRTSAGVIIQAECDKWAEKFPKESDELLEYLFTLTQQELLEILTLCMSFGLMTHQSDRESNKRFKKLADLMQVDMRKWFTPTADNYFNRLKKPQIVADLNEAQVGTEGISDSMKKGDIAKVAEKLILKNESWLPELMRK